ncbi:hypothetical protein ANCDUO_26694 [Ancylostoma duodenale]|uniref:Uncharacterized protein n=1 Tax=Ancylostoma duodenale TaxID=51022 RepID=A0A0C2BHR7_9BILA|nr:hypothetical protein ANCDUO_26694 [Ancylostoma duodenale]
MRFLEGPAEFAAGCPVCAFPKKSSLVFGKSDPSTRTLYKTWLLLQRKSQRTFIAGYRKDRTTW